MSWSTGQHRGPDLPSRCPLEQRLAELRTEIAGLRTELVRWMFGFCVNSLLGIAGLLIALRVSEANGAVS
jgi:hypothetical protein